MNNIFVFTIDNLIKDTEKREEAIIIGLLH